MVAAHRQPQAPPLAAAARTTASRDRRLRDLFFVAIAIRVSVALLIHFAVADQTLFAPDQMTYHSRGLALAQIWAGDIDLPASAVLPTGPAGYFYIVASLYYLVGAAPLLPKLLNCVVGAASVVVVHDLALRMGGTPAAALRAARFAVWFPSLILWSTLNIRDAWIVLLILLIARQALVLQQRFRLVALVVLFGALLALVQFRAYILLPVAVPVVVSFFVQRSRNLLRNLLLGGIAAVALIYADQAAGANRRLRVVDLDEIQQHRDWNTYGAASQFERADISTPGKALVFLPKGLAYFLLAPFPWTLGSIRQILAVPETLFFYWMLVWVVRGVRHLLKHHLERSLMVVLITAGLMLGYALGEGNAGTAYRHRAQVLCFFIICAAVGLETRQRPGAQVIVRP